MHLEGEVVQRLPAEDVVTVGSSYRLVARADLPRSLAAEVTQHLFEMRSALADTVPAANAIDNPAYEDTADATSAHLPIHPGAIDYYEREQETFIERYESWIYLVAILAGGVGDLDHHVRAGAVGGLGGRDLGLGHAGGEDQGGGQEQLTHRQPP